MAKILKFLTSKFKHGRVDMVFFSVILMLNLWLCLFLSSFVYYKNPSGTLNRFALIYCLATSYQVLVNFGLTVAESAEVAMIWIKIGSFTLCICAIGLHLVVYFTEKRALLRSKGFYILNYGWPLVFSLIDLFTNLTIGEVVWDGAFWVTKDPINPGLALGKAVLVDIVLVLIVMTCILYLVMVRDEIRRAQTLFIICGILVLYATGLYIPALGVTLICYAISRYGVSALTPKLTTEIVMNRLPDVLLYVDPAGRVQFANDAACLVLNYSREELLGKRFDNISTGNGYTQERVRGFQKIKATGHAGNFELNFRGKSGQLIPLLVSIAELRGPTGVFRGLLYLGREMVTIKKRESEWAKGQQELELDSVIKADFLALQSMELMKTTKSILENIRILLDPQWEPLSHSQKQHVDAILEATERLEKMGQDMHEISRAGKDLFSLHRESFPLKPLLDSIVKLFTDEAQKQDVMLQLEVPDTIGNLSADKRMIQQIVYNLISNAVRFTPGGGQVGIKAQRLSNAIQITVSDTGIGIAPEDLDKLFQAFKTVHTPVSKKYEGRGLGLYFCKRFITQHGGQIWVESQVGKGSQFHFTIPTDKEK